jgi:Arc/MetJ family transcription regulator
MAPVVRKTTIDLNVELLERAQRVLGTQGIKDTIDRALEEVVVADARRWNIEYLRNLEPIDPDELRRIAWGNEH